MTFRDPWMFRGSAVVIILFAIVGVGIQFDDAPLNNRLSALVVLGVGVVFLWCLGLRPRVTVGDEAITVVGPASTVTFPRRELVRAVGGGQFLVLERSTGGPVRVWAIQNANITMWFGGGGRSDHVANAVNLLLSGKDPDSDPDLWNVD